jgi:hypothetical protein
VSSYYRGVKFSVDPSGDGTWRCSAVLSNDQVLRGEQRGSRDDAMRASFKAIDHALDPAG